MKKIVFSFGVIAFALTCVLLSCEPKKPDGLSSSATQAVKEEPKEEVPPPVVPERGYIPLSQLALKSYIANPAAKMPETKALYSAAQKDSRELAIASKKADMKVQDKSFVMMSKTVDLCPCSTGSGLCPCPGDTTNNSFAARVNHEAKVKFDDKALKSSVNLGDDNSWVTFKWPAELKDGKHKLTITGKFTGRMQTYEVPVEVKGGQFYLKWE